MSYPLNVNDQEHVAWRARCEQLAADYLGVVDVRDVIQIDALELDPPMILKESA